MTCLIGMGVLPPLPPVPLAVVALAAVPLEASVASVVAALEVAVKVLATGREDDRQRLLREARAGGRIRHPNVIDLYDVSETERGDSFIVMELLHGETLAQRIERAPLTLEESLRILRDVARG